MHHTGVSEGRDLFCHRRGGDGRAHCNNAREGCTIRGPGLVMRPRQIRHDASASRCVAVVLGRAVLLSPRSFERWASRRETGLPGDDPQHQPKTRRRDVNKAKRVDREGPIQQAIVDWLVCVLPSETLVFSIPNENKGGARMGARLNRLGRYPGAADLCVVQGGRAHFIEVKHEGNRQTDEQKAFAAHAHQAGAVYGVARSVDDARALLYEWGVLTRETGRAIQHRGSVS